MKSESEIAESARRSLRKGDADGALQVISKTVLEYQSANAPCGLPQLDAICQEIGRTFLQPFETSTPANPSLDLYIASEIYAIGGHTSVIGDYVSQHPTRTAHLLLTNHRQRQPTLTSQILARTTLPADRVEICAASNWIGKLQWLADRIHNRLPARIFILNHPEDPLPICLPPTQPGTCWHYLHHADGAPALGLHLPHVIHIDVTPRAYHCCREILGLHDNLYLPLQGVEGANPISLRPGPILTLASSGSTGKFALDGANALAPTITEILRHTPHRYLHIGPLPEAYLQDWRAQLHTASIDPFRLLHIPRVESLWKTFFHFGVDLYLNSFPTPGAKASIEAMATGLPILSLQNAVRHHSLLYPEAQAWQTPAELIHLLHAATLAWRQNQHTASLRHYQSYHAPSTLRPLFEDPTLRGRTPLPLPPAALAAHRQMLHAFRREISS